MSTVVERFKALLGNRVQDVRESKALTNNPARLISEESGASRNMFRVNRLLDRDYEFPIKILELNPKHPLLHNLSNMMDGGDEAVVDAVVEQVFETALLQDGIHPDPAAMAERITMLMQAATGTSATQLDFANLPRMEAPAAPAANPAAGMFNIDDLETEPDIEDAEFKPVEDTDES